MQNLVQQLKDKGVVKPVPTDGGAGAAKTNGQK